jgi:hypothetical protein
MVYWRHLSKSLSPPLEVFADRRVRTYAVAAIPWIVIDAPVTQIAPDPELHLEPAPGVLKAVAADQSKPSSSIGP